MISRTLCTYQGAQKIQVLVFIKMGGRVHVQIKYNISYRGGYRIKVRGVLDLFMNKKSRFRNKKTNIFLKIDIFPVLH